MVCEYEHSYFEVVLEYEYIILEYKYSRMVFEYKYRYSVLEMDRSLADAEEYG